MQINPTSSLPTVAPADRSVADTQAQAKAYDAAAALKQVEQNVTTPKVFTPAPPLRPNVQDVVDIDRALITLRGS